MSGAHQSLLLPSTARQGRENTAKDSLVKRRTWRSFTSYCHGHFSQETIHHGPLQCRPLSLALVPCELLQGGSPAGSQVLTENMLPVVPSLHASTSPARACSRVSFPQGDFGPTVSFGIHLLWCEVSYRLQVDPCSTGTSVGCRWISVPSWTSTGCLTMVFITDCSIWRSSSFLIFGICYFYYFRQRDLFLSNYFLFFHWLFILLKFLTRSVQQNIQRTHWESG